MRKRTDCKSGRNGQQGIDIENKQMWTRLIGEHHFRDGAHRQ